MKKIDKGTYYLVKPEKGKMLKMKGDDRLYSEATEIKGKPRKIEEVNPD